MPVYQQRGRIPHPKHTTFYREDGQTLHREELFSTRGFSGIYSTKYHLRLPPGAREVAPRPAPETPPWPDAPHQWMHFFTERDPVPGDYVTSRALFLENAHVTVGALYPSEATDTLYRNAWAHELLFVHRGRGTLSSEFGRLPFGPGDYLVCPKGSTYHLAFESYGDNKLLLVESTDPFDIPAHYKNGYGQLLEHAPYHERDFRAPELAPPRDEEGDFALALKVGPRWFDYRLPHHPFDVVGWDGFVYPYAFNVRDFNPMVGRIHLPPPVHLVFATPHAVVCNFVPRLFDFHPEAIAVPYFHSNVDSDEVLYYVDGDFMSRSGIEPGSITLHPMGIPHGPQPGKTEAGLGKTRTEELAVMIDTFEPLAPTGHAATRLDPAYPQSWLAPA